jgi:hypothetical protein
MKVANMSDRELVSAMARPDNANALAPGWIRNAQGQVVRGTTPKAGGGGGGGQQQAPGLDPHTQQGQGLNPANPVTGATQQQIAHAQQAARTAAAGINAQIAGLQANNMGQFHARDNLIKRDVKVGKQDYNAQSNASGFRRSGGVRTNNAAMNAQGEQLGMENFNTYGQGRITQLGIEKNQIVRQTIDDLLGGMISGMGQNIYGGY